MRHEFILSRFLSLHGLSTVAWCASGIVICCLMYVMDCVSWFLGCRVVAWVAICCLMYVMDCVSLFLAVLLHGLWCCLHDVRHGLFIMVSWVVVVGCCTDCCLLAVTALLKDGKRHNKTNNKFCFDSGNIFTQNKTTFSVNKNQNSLKYVWSLARFSSGWKSDKPKQVQT